MRAPVQWGGHSWRYRAEVIFLVHRVQATIWHERLPRKPTPHESNSTFSNLSVRYPTQRNEFGNWRQSGGLLKPGRTFDRRAARLTHSFATRLLEQYIDIRVIQVLLGHAKLETPALHTHVATNTIRVVMSPLDREPRRIKPKASRPPPWHVQGARSRISSAAMDRRGVKPTPPM
jgi:integrase